MIISLDVHQMNLLDGNSLIKSACDKLSEYGIENFIHWSDEIIVDIAGDLHWRQKTIYSTGSDGRHPNAAGIIAESEIYKSVMMLNL